MMFRIATLGLAAAAVAAPMTPSLRAQSAPTPPAASQESQVDVDDLIDELGDASFRVRKAASKKLEKLGAEARDDLRAAAEDHDDPEVRMRAQRILRRMVQPRVEVPTPAQPRPFARLPEGWNRRMPAEFERQLEQIQEQLESLRKVQMPEFPDRMRFAPDAAESKSERVSIQIQPDGVRVEVESEEDGETKTEVFEAPDMETFRSQHPDIAKKHFDGGGGSGGRFFQWKGGLEMDDDFFRFSTPRVLNVPRGSWTAPLQPDFEAVPATGRRLGVMVEDLHPVLSEFLGFEDGNGLRVTSVEDDSLASDLGVRQGDVILEIAGETIGNRADVAKALGAIDAGESVEVKVNRRGRPVDLDAKKRESAEAQDDAPLRKRKRR